ncbi:MAG: porin family protein, partial [Acidobacteriota bacterium]|nr:porin family protein [Acidobacteriota bacterium]
MRTSPVFAATIIVICSIANPPRATGQNLAVGVMAGGSLTDGFRTTTSSEVFHFFPTSKDYLIGPTLEWRFSPRWSVEADGLFRELHLGLAAIGPNGSLGSTNREPVVTWEFPILAKYRFALSRVRPFIEAGPSFRTTGNLNGTNPSHYGFTAGAGVEMHLKQLNVAPVLRYTRWAEDEINPYQAQSNPNQL